MGQDAFVGCRRRQPEVEEAYQHGLAVEHDALTSNLRAMADAGNVVANLFLLKIRLGYREGEQLEANLTVHTGGVLVVPGKMTVEEFLEAKRAEGLIGPFPSTSPENRFIPWEGPTGEKEHRVLPQRSIVSKTVLRHSLRTAQNFKSLISLATPGRLERPTS